MEKLIKKCPWCFDPIHQIGVSVKLVEEENQYKVICPDCGAYVVVPKPAKKQKKKS